MDRKRAISEAEKVEIRDFYQRGAKVLEIADEYNISTSTLYKILNEGEAGPRMETRNVVDKLGPEIIDEMLGDYYAGAKIWDIVEKYHLAGPNILYTILRLTGSPARSKTKEEILGRQDQADHAVELYQKGLPLWQIEQETGLSSNRVMNALHKRGIKPNRHRRLEPTTTE